LCVKGNIDIAVHNAGVISISPAEEMEEAAWDHVGGVNAKGVFLCCKAVIPWMKNQGGGKIVFESLWISKRCIERFFFRLLT
jgi:meso-butanediol dehydrogenase/(S,S)-butanediol dehydrogenase/diacetyl reductase